MARTKSRRPASTTCLIPRRVEQCERCSGPLRWRTSTASRPHLLKDYGFPLELVGAAVAACSKCRSEHAAVGRSERFQRCILEQVLAKPGPLTADEILFLRKSLGMTGGDFAGLVGVSREHVSHIEQGHAPNLGTAADRLARLVIAARTDPSLVLLKKLLKSLDHNIGTRSHRVESRTHRYSVNVASRRG